MSRHNKTRCSQVENPRSRPGSVLTRSSRRSANRAHSIEELESRTLLSVDLHLAGLGAGFEPTITVNPLNPANIVAAQFNQLVISTDSGATFNTVVNGQLPTPATVYSGFGGDPSLAFDAQGRLFWAVLVQRQDDPGTIPDESGRSISVQQVNPITGALIGPNVDIDLANDQHNYDKPWLAADANPASPFANRLYLVWSRLDGPTRVMFSRSLNQGATWSAPQNISGPNGGSGFVWPSHVAVASNGDVYAAWHNQNCDDENDTISVVRDSTGGADLANADGGGPNPVQSSTFAATVTCNVQGDGDEVPNTDFWMIGSNAPYILPDPVRPGNIYVVANDDSNDNFASGDDGDVVLARSTNFGQTWSLQTISHAPAGTLQAFPIGTIDEQGNVAVFWYDTRRGLTNAGGNFLLDVYATVSRDGAQTFTNDFRINDNAFDPDLNAGCRFGPVPPCQEDAHAAMTLRIGEYNGIAAAQGTVFMDWTGNFTNNLQEIFFDQFSILGPFADRFESNDSLSSATILGSLQKVTLQDLTIDDANDVDFFKYTAEDTGKLILNEYFDSGVRDLDLRVRDARGNIIAVGVQSQITPGLDVEQLVIPVVAQQEYFIEAVVLSGGGNGIGNPLVYDLEIENIPAPVPGAVDLDRSDDSGSDPLDNVTFRTAAVHFFFHVDLNDFANEGITILTPDQAAAGLTPGAAVQVFDNGTSVGFASAVPGTNNTLFEMDLDADLVRYAVDGPNAAGPLGYRGFTNFITSAVTIFDGQRNAGGAPAPAVGRTQLGERLAVTFDNTAPLAPTQPDLLNSSDSGSFNNDDVTNRNAPAFQGTAEANTLIRIRANGLVVGEAIVGTDATDGIFGNGLGTWEVTVEPLIDGTYSITAFAEDLAGNIGVASTALTLVIDTVAPNTPYLDLIDASDSGRHNTDDVTNDNTPTLTTTANDDDRPQSPVIVPGNAFPHEICYRIFDRLTPAAELLLVDSCTATGLSIAGFFSDTLPLLIDGVHNLKLEVEDRAGNVSADFLLQLTIDTVAPPAPTIRIDPASSDTGVAGQPASIADNITHDTDTGFVGTAEADSIVRLFADAPPVSSGVLNASDVAEGLTVAIPEDGNHAFSGGQWRHAVIIDLNDPGFFPLDGLREMGVTAEDLAGNVSAPTFQEIFIDTAGPQVTGVLLDPIDAALPEQSVFDPKPAVGPTPLTRTLVINARDLPARATGAAAIPGGPFLYGAVNGIVAAAPGQYVLTGDANGVIAIASIVVINNPSADGLAATARIELNFAEPLPDDRYTLTISDSIVDDAGNSLDGESNAIEPQGTPSFPSGDGQPGSDFVARFTVDSRPEIGTFCCGSWYIDLNGNGQFDDPNNHDTDFTNGDIVYKFGLPADFPVVGDWDGNGFDELGVYGRRGIDALHPAAGFYFELDLNGNGALDNVGLPGGDVIFRFGNGGRPVAGAWLQNQIIAGSRVDHVAVFAGDTWLVDLTTAPYTPTSAPASTPFFTTARGRPIAADFNGDGDDDVGLFQSSTNTFNLDFVSDDDFQVDSTIVFGFNTPGQLAVAGDWDADGDGNIGLFVRDRNGMFPQEAAEWYLDVGRPFTGPLGPTLSNLFGTPGGGSLTTNPGDGLFQPPPTGGLPAQPNLPSVFQDIFAQFGDQLSEPIVGNFDPPSSGAVISNPVVRPEVRPDDSDIVGPDATPIFLWDVSGSTGDSGTISSVRDRDVFRFTATESGRVTIDVRKSGSALDTNLSVYGSNNRRLAANNNFGGKTDSHVQINVVAGQAYYIIVSSSRRTTGDYAVALDYLLGGSSAGSAGMPQGATRIELGSGKTTVHDRIERPKSQDYFVFTPSVKGRIELKVASGWETIDTAVDVYDSSGRVVASNDNAGPWTTDSQVVFDVAPGESYFVRVRAIGSRTGDYTLTLDDLLTP